MNLFTLDLISKGITKAEILSLQRIDEVSSDTEIWTPNFRVSLPFWAVDISGFEKWVNWNGFRQKASIASYFTGIDTHSGFDFAAFVNDKNECILGLNSKTPIRAIADGIVIQSTYNPIDGYSGRIFIVHGKERSGLSRFFFLS